MCFVSGGWGTCSSDGYLRHAAACNLTCNFGYIVVGEHPACSFGTVYGGTVACVRVDIGTNCTDNLADNYNPVVPAGLDDGSCNFTCPAIGMSPGTQSQDTSSYKTTRAVMVEFESRVTQAPATGLAQSTSAPSLTRTRSSSGGVLKKWLPTARKFCTARR